MSIGKVEELVKEANNWFKRSKVRKNAAWIEADLAPTELEPRGDNEMYWFPIDVNRDAEMLCDNCRATAGTDAMYSVQKDPRVCINCSANNQTQDSRVSPELKEQQALMILAMRIKAALDFSGMSHMHINENFKDWMVNVAATFVANHSLPYGEKLMKAISHMGGVRIPAHQAREIFKNGHGKQVTVIQTEFPDPESGCTVYAYRLTKDCGNVAYSDFLHKVIDDSSKMNEIFGPTMATAEKAGDVIEFWLGLLDVASMTKGVVDIFEDNINPTESMALKLRYNSLGRPPEPDQPSTARERDLLTAPWTHVRISK